MVHDRPTPAPGARDADLGLRGVRVSPDNFIGALKTLRTEWLTIDEITIEFGCAYGTAVKWVRAAMAHGMLVSTQGDKPEGRNGFPPAVYAVTKAWGGCA